MLWGGGGGQQGWGNRLLDGPIHFGRGSGRESWSRRETAIEGTSPPLVGVACCAQATDRLRPGRRNSREGDPTPGGLNIEPPTIDLDLLAFVAVVLVDPGTVEVTGCDPLGVLRH